MTISPIDCVSVASCDLSSWCVRPLTFFFIGLSGIVEFLAILVMFIIYNIRKRKEIC